MWRVKVENNIKDWHEPAHFLQSPEGTWPHCLKTRVPQKGEFFLESLLLEAAAISKGAEGRRVVTENKLASFPTACVN